jgi:hypothetical protein
MRLVVFVFTIIAIFSTFIMFYYAEVHGLVQQNPKMPLELLLVNAGIWFCAAKLISPKR